MTAVTTSRTWLRRLAGSVPSAWHYDPVFRWAAIGAGIALTLFVLRLTAPPARLGLGPPSVPGSSVPANLGSTYGASAVGSSPLPGAKDVPKIAPGRSLDGVTITPAPDSDRFGTVPPAGHP